MNEREQRLFDLGQNFPGLLTDAELLEWSQLRDRIEKLPTEPEQSQWSVIMIVATVLMIVIVPLIL